MAAGSCTMLASGRDRELSEPPPDPAGPPYGMDCLGADDLWPTLEPGDDGDDLDELERELDRIHAVADRLESLQPPAGRQAMSKHRRMWFLPFVWKRPPVARSSGMGR